MGGYGVYMIASGSQIDFEMPIGNPPFVGRIEPSYSPAERSPVDFYLGLDNDFLLLVNKEHAAPADLTGNLVKASDYVKTLNPEMLLNESALAALTIMFEAAAEVGFTDFRATAGFRTYEQQRELYEKAVDKSFVAPPGHSEHQTGLAVDISYHGVNIGNSVQGNWLMENSYKYGFILRYPEGKTDITGFSFEPWHYRFVGIDHARYMFENDLVLEEYVGLRD